MYYKFKLSNYNNVWGLEAEFRKLKIKSYCYGFFTVTGCIKYGKANDLEWESDYWGNRVVRQADAFLGWACERYSGCNSKSTFRNQLVQTECQTNKNFVTVVVFDYTEQLKHLTYDQASDALLDIEGQLVNSYINQYGERPPCNFAKTRGEYALNKFSALFD